MNLSKNEKYRFSHEQKYLFFFFLFYFNLMIYNHIILSNSNTEEFIINPISRNRIKLVAQPIFNLSPEKKKSRSLDFHAEKYLRNYRAPFWFSKALT